MDKRNDERLGCASNNCLLEKPSGQGTNGPCTCLTGLTQTQKIRIRKYIQRLKNERETTSRT